MQIEIIGKVINQWEEASPSQADSIMEDLSIIELKEEFTPGLHKITLFEELFVLFYFDRSEGYHIQTTTRSGDYRGVFASCSPRRPSLIGMTRVKLLDHKNNRLWVTGLDALNNTPVLDIKPVVFKAPRAKQ